MDYASLLISAIVFFMSLSLLVMTWAKKPTKKHIKEIEEAGAEIVTQIQEATEESIKSIEEKMQQLDEKMSIYKRIKEEDKQEKEVIVKKEVIKEETVISTPANNVQTNIDLKDKKVSQLYELYKKGYNAKQIAKELGMYTGVVEVYVNLFEMNKAI